MNFNKMTGVNVLSPFPSRLCALLSDSLQASLKDKVANGNQIKIKIIIKNRGLRGKKKKKLTMKRNMGHKYSSRFLYPACFLVNNRF